MISEIKQAAVKYVEQAITEERNEQIAIVTYAQNIFDDNEIIEGKRNIINFTKGFCGRGYYNTAVELSYPKDVPESVAEKVSWNREDVYGYTFEAPQGTQKLYKKLGNNNNIHNIRNINDLVTYVAPTKWGFSR